MSDLLKFKKIFDCEHTVDRAGAIEFRVANLDQSVSTARQIIAKHQLKLEVVNTADLAQIRAFEVKEVAA